MTIEVVARRVRWTKTDNYLNLQSVISSPWGDFGYRLQYDNRFFSLLPPNGSNVTQTRLYNIIDSSNLATMRQTMSARITRNSTDAVNDFVISGAKATLNYDNTHTGTLPSVWTFFNNTRTEVEFFAIRVYNRRLTDEELAANAAIDQRRFVDFGEGPLQVKYDGQLLADSRSAVLLSRSAPRRGRLRRVGLRRLDALRRNRQRRLDGGGAWHEQRDVVSG